MGQMAIEKSGDGRNCRSAGYQREGTLPFSVWWRDGRHGAALRAAVGRRPEVVTAGWAETFPAALPLDFDPSGNGEPKWQRQESHYYCTLFDGCVMVEQPPVSQDSSNAGAAHDICGGSHRMPPEDCQQQIETT
jgi:hypothetical protein